jgi:NADH dehydrogenase
MRAKRVVVLGGGFGGVAAARALKGADAEVLIIDRRNHHIFQPLLYQVATAVLAPSEVAAPLRQLSQRQPNLSVLLGEATDIELDDRRVKVSSPGLQATNIAFDYLVVATGVRPTYFGHDEFAQFAPSLKTIADAEWIRARILSAYERAEQMEDGPSALGRSRSFSSAPAQPASSWLPRSHRWRASRCARTFGGSTPRIPGSC